MTPTTFALLLHLAGVACCGTAPTTFASLAECRAAGERWLASVRERSPNDHFECVRAYVPAR